MSKYKVLYCARINDERHHGMLKVGDTEFDANKPPLEYMPNEAELQRASNARIRRWSGTGAQGAELVYCEPLVKYNETTRNVESFRDKDVQRVLQRANFYSITFDGDNDSGIEWYEVDVDTVKAAIKAVREGRNYLDTSELPEQEIYDLREEQNKAVNDTITRFENKSNMLWHAKMRFGKTITALNLVKKENYRRTIIITHRPVVEDSWGNDFYHVFNKNDEYAFITKITDKDEDFSEGNTDAAIDKANDACLLKLKSDNKKFVYFASIQDLRGSKLVGGSFEKNRVVFDMDWDLVIVDEAHEGTKTELGKKVLQLLIKPSTKKLDLSGTAYNLFDEYSEKGSVYTWDYVMEQEAKRNWAINHPNEKNPYADMPTMHIYTFDLKKTELFENNELFNKTFSFREFFRTWTGDPGKDGTPLIDENLIGKFIHEEAVIRFLDLLSQGNEASKFPYVSKDGCSHNAHTLWMIPGVKEAAALSELLKRHPFFGNTNLFGIANVAGDGDHDEESHFGEALKFVRETIEKHPNSITLSCGRLTTGVTVKEWESVFMLSGSEYTDAKQYMQTIFRVQSAGEINGNKKTDCFVYDFAPERALVVIADSILGSRHGANGVNVGDDENHKAFTDFLQFCPIIAIDGSKFEPFSVDSLVSQINRVQIDRAVRSGFTDNGIYDMSKFRTLTTQDVDKLNRIFSKLKETKKKPKIKRAGINRTGLARRTNRTSTRRSTTPSVLDQDKKREKAIIERLSTVSIRIPLLFYGTNAEIENGRLFDTVASIDQASWDTFMPEKFTKNDFKELIPYYNQETVMEAGRIIRNKSKEADKGLPTERVIAITEIFSHFHNPSKETVLTPWRVVNMHMAQTIGGWCFFNKKFEENDEEYYKRLQEPRFVDLGEDTSYLLKSNDTKFLEINSKSGLYPLYLAYSIYRNYLGNNLECEMLQQDLNDLWDKAVSRVYVLCQSSMAAQITRRTLVGFRNVNTHVKYDEKLLKQIKENPDRMTRKLLKGSYWNVEDQNMKFDAVCGNPPYQIADNGNGRSAKAIYHLFVNQARKIMPKYISLVMPARWYVGGKGLDDFRNSMLEDSRIKKLYDYGNSQDVFRGVDIAGGVCFFLWDKDYIGECEVSSYVDEKYISAKRALNDYPVFVRDNAAVPIINKVLKYNSTNCYLCDRVSSRKPFGLNTKYSNRESGIPCYFKQKIGKGFADPRDVHDNDNILEKYKFLVPRSPIAGQTDFTKPVGFYYEGNTRIALPGECCTETYLVAGAFNTKAETESFKSYILTKVVRFLLLQAVVSQDVTKHNYIFVPDLGKYEGTYNDEFLCNLWKISKEEYDYIDSRISEYEEFYEDDIDDEDSDND